MRSRFQVFKRKPKEARTSSDGLVFDSVGEMKRWEELKVLQQRGIIRNLQRQIAYLLHFKDDAKTPVLTEKGRQRRYRPDFIYEELENTTHGSREWTQIWEDYKGIDDPTSQLRRNFFEGMVNRKVRITGPAAAKKKRVVP